MTQRTNANSPLLGMLLNSSRKGTFSGLITQKVGKTVGPKGSKVTYGDDVVHTVMITGFSYERLVERSLKALDAMTVADLTAEATKRGLQGYIGKGKNKVLTPILAANIGEAMMELKDSFNRTLDDTQESESTTAHVYEPLVMDGEVVVGARVYRCVADTGRKCKCRACTDDAKAPLDGTIYLQGLKIWSKILTPAPNGKAPAVKSAPKTVAKNMIRGLLPVSRYVSYRLEPLTDFMLRAGGTAEIEATEQGFLVTDEIVDVINKVA